MVFLRYSLISSEEYWDSGKINIFGDGITNEILYTLLGLPGITLYSIEWVWTVFIQFEIGVFQWNEDIESDYYMKGAPATPALHRNLFDDATILDLFSTSN